MRRLLVLVVAAAVMVSGYIHFYLYFRGGYRGIAPESFLGLTISRSFALNAIAALVIAEVLVLTLRYERMMAIVTLGAVGFAISTLVAYTLTRTTGLLGFSDDQTNTEAIIAVTAEIVALIGGVGILVTSRSSASGRSLLSTGSGTSA